MDIACEPCPEGDGDLGLQELDHGVGVRREGANTEPLADAPEEGLAVACHQVTHDLSVESCYHQRKICAQHEEDAMADQQPRLLAVPARYHDVQ